MGSLEKWSGLVIAPDGPPNIAGARLPFYNLAAHERDGSCASAPSVSNVRYETRENFPILSSNSAVLRAFATFVCAVAEVPQASFVAVTEQCRYVAVASGYSTAKLWTPSYFDTSVSLHVTETSDTRNGHETDFEICISPICHTKAQRVSVTTLSYNKESQENG